MIRVNIFLSALILILLFLFHQGCTSFQTIKLPNDYAFETKNIVTVYVQPSGVEDFDDIYARVMCLDFQSRGYYAINANEEVKKYGDSLIWTNHREIADALINKSYLPNSDVIIIVKPDWKQVDFITNIQETETAAGKVYQNYGFRVWSLYSETAFYDRYFRLPIMSYSAKDTTHMMMDEKTKLYYPELPWMLIARQLTSNINDIKVCSKDNSPIPENKFPVVLLVDKSYRDAFPNNWAVQLKLRMLYANDILRRQLGVELEIKEIKEWNSEFTSSLNYMLQKLHALSNPGHTIRIGITLDKKLKALSVDRAFLGLAYPLQKDAIISVQPTFPGLRLWGPMQESITMAHEISHLLGCIHVNDTNSIMYPFSGGLTYKFDDVNIKIGRHMKNFYFDSDKNTLLKEYASELLKIKRNSPENAFMVLSPIAKAFINLFMPEQSSYKDSEKLESDLIKIIPDTVYALSAAGYVRYNQNYLQDAEKFFTRALEMNPDFDEAHWYLGSTLEKLGNKAEAEKHFAKTRSHYDYWMIDKSF